MAAAGAASGKTNTSTVSGATKPKVRAPAGIPRRRAPGGPDYTVPGIVPPPETWVTSSRAAIALTAPARTKMAAAATATSYDLPLHAAYALFSARTRAPVDGAECVSQWMHLTLRADLCCAPVAVSSASSLWPNSSSSTTTVNVEDRADTATGGDWTSGGGGGGDDDDGGDNDNAGDDWGAPDGPISDEILTTTTTQVPSAAATSAITDDDANVALPTTLMPTIEASGPVTLVAAVRHVEKIRVRYETTSKRVDVGALKRDFWGAIAGARSAGSLGTVTHVAQETAARIGAAKRAASWMDVSGAGNATTENRGGGGASAAAAAAVRAAAVGDLGAAAKGNPLAFTQVITDLAPSNSQQVTVAYYFITLLHLANEHGLALTSTPGLSDLGIRDLGK